MDQAARTDDNGDMPGILLPESKHELLRDLCDELQLLATLIATTYPIDDEVVPMKIKRAALAGYLRRVAERIESALEDGSWPAGSCDALAEAP